MKFIIKRKNLLKPLQQINSTLCNKRQVLPILSNLLMQVIDNYLLITSTDLEIELLVKIMLIDITYEPGSTTVSAKKFLDICRCLPDESEISVKLKNNRMSICSGRSRFFLSTLPASDFPNLDNKQSEVEFTVPQEILKRLIESTQFSMAHHDVRYYLNGMLLEINDKKLRTVATDGHRLAICSIPLNKELPFCSVIVPRRGIIELARILENSKNLVKLCVGSNNIYANIDNYIFSSKLICGHFPDYNQVLPKYPSKFLKIDCNLFKQALIRISILSNEKLHNIQLQLNNNQLKITAKNLDQEEAEEIIDVSYQGIEIEIGFNVNYLLDVLNVLKCKDICMLFTDEISSVQIENCVCQEGIYIIMPIRI